MKRAPFKNKPKEWGPLKKGSRRIYHQQQRAAGRAALAKEEADACNEAYLHGTFEERVGKG